jgi:2-oxo-4-hydroxy-4-carboxy--5-ureidoimidazoline (OHCU) decarboxylase
VGPEQQTEQLFEPSPLARLLVATGPHPDLIAAARNLVARLDEDEKVATLNAHPRIGEQPDRMSAASRAEQEDLGDGVPSEVRLLNEQYEQRFGFRFVVFVNRRPRSEIVPEMRSRIRRGRDQEIEEGLRAVLDIAEDRLRRAR